MIKHDPNKLKAALHSRGVLMTNASIACGKNKFYIANRNNEGQISGDVVFKLKELYNIKPEEYIGEEIEDSSEGQLIMDGISENLEDFLKELKTENEKVLKSFMKEMSKVIYDATYTAVKRAWEDD